MTAATPYPGTMTIAPDPPKPPEAVILFGQSGDTIKADQVVYASAEDRLYRVVSIDSETVPHDTGGTQVAATIKDADHLYDLYFGEEEQAFREGTPLVDIDRPNNSHEKVHRFDGALFWSQSVIESVGFRPLRRVFLARPQLEALENLGKNPTDDRTFCEGTYCAYIYQEVR